MIITLAKHHGLGNDFLVLHNPPDVDLPSLARKVCDRRRGVGADGLLIVEDADAPTPQPLVLAIVVDLPGGYSAALPAGALPSGDHAGSGVKTGRNSYLQAGWLPPDPPPGHGVHRYVFQVFALEAGGDPFDEKPGREAVTNAIRERGLASGCLIGTYERPDTSIATPVNERASAASFGTPPLAA